MEQIANNIFVETARQLRSYDRRYPPHLLESLTQRHPEKGQELSNSPVAKPTISFSTVPQTHLAHLMGSAKNRSHLNPNLS